MFTIKLYDVTEEEEFIGSATIDELAPEVVSTDVEYDRMDDLIVALHDNIEEIIDLHNVMLNDPDGDDSLGIELIAPDSRAISVCITNEEDA